METGRHPSGTAVWLVRILAVVFCLIGITMGVGGGWRAALGGSFYYLVAGVAVFISGTLLFKRLAAGAWVYVVVFLGMLVWAFWEAGLNAWALVPRLVGAIVLLCLVVLALPVLRPRWSRASTSVAAMLVVAIAGGWGVTKLAPEAAAQPLPKAVATITDTSTLQMGLDWPTYGGTYSARRYSALKQITPENVGQLKRVWLAHAGDLPSKAGEGTYGAETTPLKVGDTLYLGSAKNILIALEPATGKWLADYHGIFTPPLSDRHTIEYPGCNGGSDWGGMAIDPLRGVIIANYNDMPNYVPLASRKEADERGWRPRNQTTGKIGGVEGAGDPQAGAPCAIEVNAGWQLPVTGLLCNQPPYGGIRAIDLRTGKPLWDRPLGEARTNGPFGIPSRLPWDVGTPNNGGAVVTAGGLIFIAAATDNLIRAIDLETAKTVWSDALPAGDQATPIAYEFQRRQHVVIMTGGHHFMKTPVGDQVIAYSLPQQARRCR